MDEIFFQRIEEWHQAGENQQIVDCILQIPAGERDYRLTSLLARAYINMEDGEHWEEALELLLGLEADGREDYLWYIRVGGVHARLLHEKEAEEWFQKGLALLGPESEKYRDQEAQCREILRICRVEIDRKAAWESYQDSLDPEKALEFVLHGLFHGDLGAEDRIEGETVFLPKYGIRILPKVAELRPRGVVLDLWVEAPQWGKRLYECSTGMGGSPGQALGFAVNSFLFSFIDGLIRMEDRVEPREVESRLDGKVHRWELYPSSIIGLGASPQPEGQVWWDALGDEIKQRLGNQRLCYVKIYGAKVNGEVTGECRIDDVKSEELSAKVAQIVEGWPEAPFSSQKQFFFLRQREETLLPWPYEGDEGREWMLRGVIAGAKMFLACRSEEDYDSFTQRLTAEIGDKTLAEEFLTFLPELCAGNSFPDLPAAETVDICRDGRDKETVYKNQLADFYALWNLLFDALRSGVFGEDADEIYRKLVGYSSTYQVIRQLEAQGERLEDCRLTSLSCQVDEDFEIR